jgi:excisionase family DNA binding protein
MLAMAQAVADILLASLEKKLHGLARPEHAADDAPLRPPPAADEWLTAEAAARHLGMKKRAFYSAVQRRQIPASRLGRRLRFNRTGLDHLLLRRQGRGVQLTTRVPSPGKESERWSR